RQVQQVEHPENQRIARGDQGITASQHQPIDDLLDERRQHGGLTNLPWSVSVVTLVYFPNCLSKASIFACTACRLASCRRAWRYAASACSVCPSASWLAARLT